VLSLDLGEFAEGKVLVGLGEGQVFLCLSQLEILARELTCQALLVASGGIGLSRES